MNSLFVPVDLERAICHKKAQYPGVTRKGEGGGGVVWNVSRLLPLTHREGAG